MYDKSDDVLSMVILAAIIFNVLVKTRGKM